MIDIARQVAYWRDGAGEDWAVAQDLMAQGRVRYALFFAHLALEKALKAHVCRQTNDLAPRMHNLIRLAEIGVVRASQDFEDVLAEMNAFNLEGRYPDMLMPPPSLAEARDYLIRAEEVLQWLLSQL
ncbi:MAG: HEPN domain-containing protein [Chloroflexi bacterium]|nr:HEPN domain-containing protein [Chloroflexota bacterium]